MAVIDRKKKCVFVKGCAYPGIPELLVVDRDLFLVDEGSMCRFPDETKEIMLDAYLEKTEVLREPRAEIRSGKIIGVRLFL